MSDVILGYEPIDGRLITGKHQDNRRNWVQALYVGDDVMFERPTELDRAVFGEDIEVIAVVSRSVWQSSERYRLATSMSFYCANSDDAAREDDMLTEAARGRFEPEDEDAAKARQRDLTG